MKFAVIVFAVSLILTMSNCRHLKSVEKDDKIKLILNQILVQHRLTGFLIFSTDTHEANSDCKFVFRNIVRQATKLTTIALMNRNIIKNPARYTKNISRFNEIHKSLSPLQFLTTAASDNVCLIFIVESTTYTRKTLLLYIEKYHLILSSPQRVPKMLLVLMARRGFNSHRKVLESSKRKCVVDILEIKKSVKSSTVRFSYNIIQYNPYTRQLKLLMFRYNDTRLLSDLSNNLRRHKLIVSFRYSRIKAHNRFIRFMHKRYGYVVEVAIMKLNGTVAWTQGANANDPDIYLFPCLKLPLLCQSYIYPSYSKSPRFILPVIYDEFYFDTYETLITCSMAMILLLIILWLFRRYYSFNDETWHSIIAISIILGVSITKNPVHKAEYLMFMLLTTVGFFFASDLVNGLTSVAVPQTFERDLQTIDDVSRNNITLLLLIDTHGLISKYCNKSNVKYKLVGKNSKMYYDAIEQMLRLRDVSISSQLLELAGTYVPQKIIINNVVYARLSNINDEDHNLVYAMKRNQLWFHRFNYYYLKFHECALNYLPKDKSYRDYCYYFFFEKYIKRFQSEVIEETATSTQELDSNLWLIIVLGSVLALSALLIENFILSAVFHSQ